jgi:cell wall-associated NlpC family hydrolase
MNQHEFITKIKGKPWVNRASSFDSVDCFGLIILYYKHVMGIDLPTVNGFAEKDNFIDCYNSGVKNWTQVNYPDNEGIAFTCYKGEVPTHVGLCIGKGLVLHARGGNSSHGKVEIHKARAIERLYGKMTYHKFIG